MERAIRSGVRSIYRSQRPNFLDFTWSASHMEDLEIQPLHQTLIQEGGGLEVGLATCKAENPQFLENILFRQILCKLK